MPLPVCGITMGDPAGIGPEILLKAAAEPGLRAKCHLLAVADLSVLERTKKAIVSRIELVSVDNVESRELEELSASQLGVYDMQQRYAEELQYGVVKAEYGKSAYNCIIKAIDLALEGQIGAVVTNPINKEAINAAGVEQAGHTEIFAAKTNTKNYAMMLVHDALRVVHVSTHVSLREACNRVKKERVLSVIRLTADTLKGLDGAHKTIAVAGLNPHAGEHGLFGSEETKEIIPAVEAARSEGIKVEGPLPPDTVFSRALGGEFSAVVVMYHDQGHIPLKLAGFQVDPATGKFGDVSGVNITLGLPIIRTSVDHGTAFDVAGRGIANHKSLVQAIEYAVRLYES